MTEKDIQPNKENIVEPTLNSQESDLFKLMKQNDHKELAEKAPNPWKLSKKGKEAVSQGVAMFQTGFGLYAAIPMLCKGEECPYAKLFPELHQDGIEDGERCPVEVSFIMTKYQTYLKELMIHEDDAVDLSLLRDLIDYDVQILRADNRIAIEGGFLEEQVVAVSDNGQPVVREDISPTANYKDKIQAKRNKTLEMLNSTRKDKVGTKISHVLDPSSYASELLKRASVDSSISIEATFDELEVIEDTPYIQELNKEKMAKKNLLDEAEKNQARLNQFSQNELERLNGSE